MITNIDDCIDKLYAIDELIENRLSQLRENKKINLKRLIVVVDELYPILMRKDKKEIYNLIGKMLSRSRIARINFILCTQRIVAEIVPMLILANIDIRVAMKTASAQESQNILGVSDAFYIKDSGVGIVNLNGQLKKFKAYYVDEDKIGDYIPKVDKKNDIENVNIENDKTYNITKETTEEIIYFD